jgi:N-acetylmuramoyl-L-alanine amidase
LRPQVCQWMFLIAMNNEISKGLLSLHAALAFFVLSFLSAGAADKDWDASQIKALISDPSSRDWQGLRRFDSILTRKEFEESLAQVFDPDHGLDPFLHITDQGVTVFAQSGQRGSPLATIAFAPDVGSVRPMSQSYRRPQEWRKLSGSAHHPLDGLRLAIEPADIGGDWGVLEDRSTYYPHYGRIQEGDINLVVAKILRDQLESLGAQVYLVRQDCEPVADFRPSDIRDEVRDILAHKRYLLPEAFFHRVGNLAPDSPRYQQIAAEVLFTKTFETRARAKEVQAHFKPDMTIVLQHNATPASINGGLAPSNRNIFFVEGAYMSEELDSDPVQRFRLLTKLFEQVTPSEVQVADKIARQFERLTGYAPVLYGNSTSTRLVKEGDSYVVARNLAFNREHDGPVVVTEPYYMNNPLTLRRLLAGNYEGLRIMGRKAYRSIYQEYAEAVSVGIVDAYCGEDSG